MKRLMVSVAATTAALAVVQVGVASAATATFEGNCTITGVAKFGTPLVGQPANNTYDFKSGDPGDGSGDKSSCTGKLNGQPIDKLPVTATVAGPGSLSCVFSRATSPGTGALVFPDGSTFTVAFDFVGVATEVVFRATDTSGGNAVGRASFQKYVPQSAPADCAGTKGLSQLGFEASLNGTSKFTGTKPDAPVSNVPPVSNPPVSGGPSEEEPTSRCDRLRGKKQRQCVAIERCKQIESAKKRKKCMQKARGKKK